MAHSRRMADALSSASSAFGLKLPKPAGPILKHEPGQGQRHEAVGKSSSPAQAEKSCGTLEKISEAKRFKSSDLTPSPSHLQKLRPEVHDVTSDACESLQHFIDRDRRAMLERELRLQASHDPLPLVRMPLLTLKQLKTHLWDKFGHQPNRDVTILVNESSILQHQADIDRLIAEVERTRLLAVFTEEPDPGQEARNNGEAEVVKETVVITLATFSGLTLIIRDPRLVPNKIKTFLTEVAVAKISSRPDRDCKALQKVGISLRGWIDSGAIYRALLNNDANLGLEVQARFLEAEGYVKAAPQLSNQFEAEALDAKQRLAIENVLVPTAVTLASALHFGLKRGYPDDKQMFPVIFEAIDLVRNRVPEDLEDLAADPIKNWMVGIPGLGEKHRTVNDPRALLSFRLMRADFVEVFDPNFNPREAAKVPFRLFVDPDGERVCLPCSNSIRKGKGYIFKGRCNNCGKFAHQTHHCPELRNGQSPVCVYPHDGVPDLRPHSTRLCPILHHACLICRVKGHSRDVHVWQNFSHRELRERFFQHAHLGLLTSLPYLSLFPEARAKMIKAHWRGGYRADSFNRDLITRYQLGISGDTNLSLVPDRAQRDREDAVQLVAADLEAVKRHADADDPRDTKPIPADLLKQETENLTKSSMEQN